MMRGAGINGWLAGVRASKPLMGVFWMVLAGLSFVTMTGIVRSLGTDIPAAQSAFLRFAWGGCSSRRLCGGCSSGA